VATAVRRGLAAGFVAGLLAGALALLVGEPALSRAVALEAPAGPGGFAGYLRAGSSTTA
jgi:thiamine transporter ThiT